MADAQYAKPPALAGFSLQGTWTYRPLVVLIEEDSIAALQTRLDQEVGSLAVDPDLYWVIKDIQYETVAAPPGVKYSLMFHVEIVERV